MKCKHCGYRWATKSRLMRVCCPNCGGMNKIRRR